MPPRDSFAALSSTDGTSFTQEADLRLSTAADSATLFNPVVVRSTASFRWRMFTSYFQNGSSIPFVSGALTMIPVVTAMTPNIATINQTSQTFTLAGEIFSPSPSVEFYAGSTTMTAFSVARPDDQTLTGSFNPYGRPNGNWNAVVTNADGYASTLARALFIDVPPGDVSILDNLFRPLKGGSAKITLKVNQSGDLLVQLYTVNGGLVATLYDGPVSAGATSLSWPGTTSSGNIVASGVYLLRVKGPKLDTVERIVVVK